MITLELVVWADEGDNGRALCKENLGVVEKVELAREQDGSTLVRRRILQTTSNGSPRKAHL